VHRMDQSHRELVRMDLGREIDHRQEEEAAAAAADCSSIPLVSPRSMRGNQYLNKPGRIIGSVITHAACRVGLCVRCLIRLLR
jgi:hypothetical protein